MVNLGQPNNTRITLGVVTQDTEVYNLDGVFAVADIVFARIVSEDPPEIDYDQIEYNNSAITVNSYGGLPNLSAGDNLHLADLQ